MFEIYISHTGFGGHTTDPLNRFHETALREARIATEWHGLEATASAEPSLVSRVRAAFSRPRAASAEACGCPA